ncbi:MAG: glycerol-3-phosphate 1-O-acyltransferase PlsY [Armatimonadetes bacterium]|nr:glycerol-3-phosphate 1-O-acyltransferase PlsY [Armatimonadota bacterium]
MTHLLLALGAYVLGAIPFGVLAARLRGVDLAKVGSGSTGATNVHRALGWQWSLPVFLLDVGKGFIPALLARGLIEEHATAWSLGIGLCAVLGHCASPFLRFRGGKGVATGLGAILGSTPLAAAGALAVFVLIMVATQYVSLGSLLATGSLLIFDYIFISPIPVVAGHGLLVAMVWYRHRSNIKRLREGKEPKFKFKNKDRADGGYDRTSQDVTSQIGGAVVECPDRPGNSGEDEPSDGEPAPAKDAAGREC